MKVQAGCGKKPKGSQVWDRNRRTGNCGLSITHPWGHPANMGCLVGTALFVTDYCTQQFRTQQRGRDMGTHLNQRPYRQEPTEVSSMRLAFNS